MTREVPIERIGTGNHGLFGREASSRSFKLSIPHRKAHIKLDLVVLLDCELSRCLDSADNAILDFSADSARRKTCRNLKRVQDQGTHSKAARLKPDYPFQRRQLNLRVNFIRLAIASAKNAAELVPYEAVGGEIHIHTQGALCRC